MLQSSAK